MAEKTLSAVIRDLCEANGRMGANEALDKPQNPDDIHADFDARATIIARFAALEAERDGLRSASQNALKVERDDAREGLMSVAEALGWSRQCAWEHQTMAETVKRLTARLAEAERLLRRVRNADMTYNDTDASHLVLVEIRNWLNTPPPTAEGETT